MSTSPPSGSRTLARIGAGLCLLLVAGAGYIGFLYARGKSKPEAQADFRRPVDFVRDIGLSEKLMDESMASVKSSFVKGLRSRDWALLQKGLTEDFTARFPAITDGSSVPDGLFKVRKFGAAGLEPLDRAKFVAVLQGHVGEWSSVERTTWRTFTYLSDKQTRVAYAELHFQVAGLRPSGARVDLQGVLRTEIVPSGESWRIRRLEWMEGCRLESDQPAFADITDAVGFHFNDSEQNRKLAQAIIDARAIKTAGGLSAVDWNRDGFWDLTATVAGRHTVVFVNDGRGGFVPEPSPASRAEDAGYMTLFADLDNDGVEELVSTTVLDYSGTTGHLALYARRNGAWELQSRALKCEFERGVREVMFQPIVAADFDRNGFLDLYFGGYSDSSSGGERFNSVSAYDGADDLLFMNYGGLKFVEESERRGLHGTQYALAAQAFDFDNDGHLDLFECNDFGPDILWRNDGNGNFEQVKSHLLARDSAYGMGVTIADFDNTGNWSVYVSNMYSHAGNRIVPLAEGISDSMRAVAKSLAHGNQLFEQDPATGQWAETSLSRAVNWADWAWGCVFADFDNDRDKDLFVANGYTSNENRDAPDW